MSTWRFGIPLWSKTKENIIHVNANTPNEAWRSTFTSLYDNGTVTGNDKYFRIEFLISNLDPESPVGEAQISMWDKNFDQGQKVSGLTIRNTDDLQKLHEAIMQKLRHLLSYEVEASMFFNPPEVEDVTFTWIRGYGDKHDNPSAFHPHMTVGFGETDT